MSRFDEASTGLKVVSKPESLEYSKGVRSLQVTFPQSPGKMVRRFHDVALLPVNNTEWDTLESNVQIALILEEYGEWLDAVDDKDDVATLDAICDLVYVLVGMAVRHGWDFDEAFKRVHRSNMTKVSGAPVKFRDDGKILKNEDYEPPDLEDLV